MEKTGNNKPLKNVINYIKDDKVRSFIDYQQKQLESLQKLIKTESIKNQIFQLLFSENNINDVVDAILNYFHEIFPGEIRCVISPDQERYHSFSNLVFTLGEKGEDLSYLDEQIENLLETRRHVLISDSSKSRELKYSQNKPYPVAVAAFPIKTSVDKQKIGFIWFALNQTCDFSREKIRPIFELVEVLSIVLKFYLEKLEDKYNFEVFSSIVNNINEPLMLFSKKYELIWSNRSANKVFSEGQGEISETGIDIEVLHVIKENLKKYNGEFIIHTNEGSYTAVKLSANAVEPEVIHLLKFVDKTNAIKNNELLSLVLNIVRNNLTSSMDRLQGLVMLLSTQGIINDYQNDSLAKINEEISRANSIISELLKFIRFQSYEKIIADTIKTKVIIDHALQILDPKATQKGITLSKEAINAEISADRMLITQAIINLIDNAIRYSHLGGEIFINESMIDNRWRIEIKDNGKGMSAIDVKQLMAGSPSTDSEMKGFHIAQEIARLHGGEVKVESNLGEGTKVCFEIPTSI